MRRRTRNKDRIETNNSVNRVRGIKKKYRKALEREKEKQGQVVFLKAQRKEIFPLLLQLCILQGSLPENMIYSPTSWLSKYIALNYSSSSESLINSTSNYK